MRPEGSVGGPGSAGDPAVDLSVPGLAALQRRRSDKWAGWPEGVQSMTIAEMDFPLAPAVAAALHAAIDRHDLGYAPPAPDALRRAFVEFAKRRLRWTVDPKQVTLVPDVMAGLIELCRVLVAPGGAVAFASPGYPPFHRELPQAGVRAVGIPLLADGGFDLDRLERELAGGARAVIVANPHNPTGRVLPASELRALADLAETHGAWVLADEIHAPLVLPGAVHTPWLEVSAAARRRGFALTSASKAFNVAGLKAALLVTADAGPAAQVARMPVIADRAGLLGVVAAEAAFAAAGGWLDAVLAQLDANRSLLADMLPARLPGVFWVPPQGTFLAWLDCRGLGLGDDPARRFLERGAVALSPGLDYGPEGAGFVRLNFGTSPELLEGAVERMARAL
jgi:cystathionine beta-lyase